MYKTKWSLQLMLLLALAVFSCSSNDDTNPLPEPEVIPDTYSELNFSRTLHHNADGKLIRVQMVSVLPNGATEETNQYYTYNTQGRMVESNTGNGWRMVYTFSGDKMVRTDEYINSTLRTQYHTFEYTPTGKLAKSITYQNIPEEGGEIPVSSSTYEYDEDGNLTFEKLFYYTTGGAEAVLLTVFKYGAYDDQPNSENLFSINPFNPFARFSENNPGQLEVKNGNGVVSSTNTYTYQYNTKGYPVKKSTHIVLHNGEQGDYETIYTFK